MKLEKWEFVIKIIQLILNIITVIGAVYILFSSLYDTADIGFRKVMLSFTYFIFIGSSILINLFALVLIYYYLIVKGNKKSNSFIKYIFTNIFWYISIGLIGFLIGDSIIIFNSINSEILERYPLAKFIFLTIFTTGFLILFIKFTYKVYSKDYSKESISSNFFHKFSSNIIIVFLLFGVSLYTTGKENINILKKYEVQQKAKQQIKEEENIKLDLIIDKLLEKIDIEVTDEEIELEKNKRLDNTES